MKSCFAVGVTLGMALGALGNFLRGPAQPQAGKGVHARATAVISRKFMSGCPASVCRALGKREV